MSEGQTADDFPRQVHYGTHTPTVRFANSMEGCLCVTLDHGYVLRVKDARNPEGFVDYHLRHSDLQARIIDEDAAFYDFSPNLDPLLDHAPATLGLTVIATGDGSLKPRD
jgi:hypothetical protein